MIRSAAGKDVVTIRPLDDRLTARRIQERLNVVVMEENDNFKIEVQRGDKVAADILSGFGGQTSTVYVRRPSLEAGLRRIAQGNVSDVVPSVVPFLTSAASDSEF
jgi:hypothetical protein